MILPFNLQEWISKNRALLKPPVGNKVLWEDSEFIAMIVGGPNGRNDFHIDESEEIFYQLEGTMVLRIWNHQKIQNITIKQGEMFLLPKKIPHSPQRYEESIGLVIERKRKADEKDGFMWICDDCNKIVYETFVGVNDIEKDMPKIFQEFYADKFRSTCRFCQKQVTKPSGPWREIQ